MPRGSVRGLVGKPILAEKDFQKQVIDLARLRGWLVAHTYDSRLATGTGYPDLTLCRQGRIAFVELKTERGRLRPEQKVWLEALRTCVDVEVYIWKPRDWADIERILQ